MPAPQPPSARRSAVFALIVFVAFYGGIEGLLRIVGVRRPTRPLLILRAIDSDIDLPFMRADPELFWAPRPGFAGEFMGRSVTINSHGLRGTEPRELRPRRRVLCLGDSITFGYGVGDDESYPAALGRALAGQGVEVVNGGVTGYTSEQVRRLFDRLAPVLRPDVVSLCVGWNDRTLRPATDREYARQLETSRRVARLAEHLYLYRALAGLYLRARDPLAADARRTPRVPAEQYRENLEAIVAAARASGIRPVFVALPHRSRLEGPPLDPAYPATLRAVAAALAVPLLEVGALGDAAPPEGNEALFIDSLHLSPAGAEVMAGELFRQILSAGLLGAAPAR